MTIPNKIAVCTSTSKFPNAYIQQALCCERERERERRGSGDMAVPIHYQSTNRKWKQSYHHNSSQTSIINIILSYNNLLKRLHICMPACIAVCVRGSGPTNTIPGKTSGRGRYQTFPLYTYMYVSLSIPPPHHQKTKLSLSKEIPRPLVI